MNSIRLRLFLMMAAVGGTSGGLLYQSYQAYLVARISWARLDVSARLVDQISTTRDSRFAPPEVEALKPFEAQLEMLERKQRLHSAIEVAAKGNSKLAGAQFDTVQKNEREYQRFLRNEVSLSEKRLPYLALWALISLAVGFLFVHVYLSSSIIRRLRDLSRKMEDFLQDRYTYQFSVPAPDEIGHVQATFNSLAQRVLMNVEELKNLDQAKSDFLSIASHELRTPLTSIKGSLSLMRSGVVGEFNDMSQNLMTIAETETDRLIRLINDILDLAKIEARKLPLSVDWHPLPRVIETTFQSLKGFASQAECELVVTTLPQIEIYVDQDRIQQVLTNLLSNAIKHSPKGAPVTVHCDLDTQNEILIEVLDQGRGIDPQDQELIFQKFRQITNPKNPLVKGTGLGLAIAKAVVEEHGGQIGVKSQPGQGSTFYFSLPRWRFAKQKAVA